MGDMDKVMDAADVKFNEETKDNQIIYTDDKDDFQKLKQKVSNIYKEEDKKTFIINKSFSIVGKVIPNRFIYKEPLILYSAFKITNDDYDYYKLNFINDPQMKDKKNQRKVFNFAKQFFNYDIITKDQQRFRLFSEKEIESNEYEIKGLKFCSEDFMDIGYNTKVKIEKPIIFVNEAISKIIKFKTHIEFINFIKQKKLNNKDNYFDWIFYHEDNNKIFRQTNIFEYLLSSFILHCKFEAYPMHLMIIAKPGTGKSTIEECVHCKVDEYNDIVEGSGSTIKSLIPSFKSTTPEQGALMKANRFALVDEFLRILMRIDKDDREHQLGALNTLLEHKKREFSSGNSKIRGVMTAKFFSVTNPIWKSSTIDKLIQQIDLAFSSRLFIWYQENDHIKFVQSKQGVKKPKHFTIDVNDWLAIIDYCGSFKSVFDEQKVFDIHKKFSELLIRYCIDIGSDDLRDMFAARYSHHCMCLIDGIIKTRCIIEGDNTFEAKQEDYDMLQEILKSLIINWGILYVQDHRMNKEMDININ